MNSRIFARQLVGFLAILLIGTLVGSRVYVVIYTSFGYLLCMVLTDLFIWLDVRAAQRSEEKTASPPGSDSKPPQSS